jgi:hypothetical protein
VLVVGSAYLVQGLTAVVGANLIGYLTAIGVPLETQVGLLASGAVPWVFKFVIALLLDLGPSWSMRARGLLLTLLQACAAVCVWTIAREFVDGQAPPSIPSVAAAWIALNACVATQDVLVDALALDALHNRRAATATAMSVGAALGFGVLDAFVIAPRIAERGMAAGLASPAWWIAGLALLPAALLWSSGRPSKARERAESRAWQLADLGRLAWMLALFVALMFAAALTQAVGFAFLVNRLGWQYPTETAILSFVAALCGLVGALACGPLVARLGPPRAAMICSALLGLAWLSFASVEPFWSQRFVVLTLASSEAVLQPALLVALHALALSLAARSPLPTTAFVLGMAALNLPRVLAPLVAPHALQLGWVGLFAACGLAQLLASGGVLFARPREQGSSAPS